MSSEHSWCMRLHRPGETLALEQRPVPTPGPGQVLLKVSACGVCRTDLHLIDGELPDAAIIFAPAGELVPLALQAVRKGGRVICGGIHMSDIPSLPYSLLWGERSIRSVANLTRRDGVEFQALAGEIGILPSIETLPLARANEALERLRTGALSGAAVLIP